ncbi:MAG: CHAD domain-containing protein [Anaerolineae bacterium]
MEVEAKFTLTEEGIEAAANLHEIAGYTLGPARTRYDLDHYVDTSHMDIVQGGYAARLRQREGRMIATLKSLTPTTSAIHTREELETEVGEDGWRPQTWPPSETRDVAVRLTQDTPLRELFTVRQARQVRLVYRDDNVVAEWSLDQGTITAGEQSEPVRELEIELVQFGTPHDLNILATAVGQLPGVTPEPMSKFERGMRLHLGQGGVDKLAAQVGPAAGEQRDPDDAPDDLKAEALARVALAQQADADKDDADDKDDAEKPDKKGGPGVEPDDPMAEAGRKVLAFHFQRMLKEEDGAREGADIEAVHKMRVATRRMRAALKMFAPYYKARVVRDLEADLADTARALGRVRDLDVALAHVDEYAETLPAEARVGLEPLTEHWRKRRDKARKKLIAWLDGGAYKRFIAHFTDFVETPGKGALKTAEDEVQPILVRHLAPAAIWDAFAEVRAFDRVVANAPVEVLHQLRIHSKRLRYTLEFFAEDLGPNADLLVNAVTAMQDHLGELHDAHVSMSTLGEFLTQQRHKGRELPAVQDYLQARADAEMHYYATFAPVWESIVGESFRKKLGKAVARL